MKPLCYMASLILLLVVDALQAKPTEVAIRPAQVQIQLDDQIRVYKYTPKLSEVLAPVAFKREWYWPASALYSLDDVSAGQLQQQVLTQIETLKAQSDKPLMNALNRVGYFIGSWQLATRVSIAIDYDLARTRPEFNLGFDNGRYRLKLNSRPQHVEFWGAIAQVTSMPHSGAKTVTDYLQAIHRDAVAEQSYVLVIQPDGEILTVGVASWNAEHIELMPGSSVFIPFASSLWLDLTSLNKDIARLARHRVK